ncbi:MAG: hypothetical protein AAF253_12130 [Pseudomonadota bacterium]
MTGENGFVKGVVTLSLVFIALMGIYALWAEEISAAFWKTVLSFSILLLLSVTIQRIGRPARDTTDPTDRPA